MFAGYSAHVFLKYTPTGGYAKNPIMMDSLIAMGLGYVARPVAAWLGKTVGLGVSRLQEALQGLIEKRLPQRELLPRWGGGQGAPGSSGIKMASWDNPLPRAFKSRRYWKLLRAPITSSKQKPLAVWPA